MCVCYIHSQLSASAGFVICGFDLLWIRHIPKKKKKKKIPESLKNQNLSLPRAQHYTEFMQMK